MRSRWNLPIYVVYTLFCLLVLGFIVRGLQFSVPWSNPYHLTATFSDADGILPNNEVFLNGTKVGYVGAVSVVNGQAKVNLVFDNGNAVPLHPDAKAQVRKKNLLGETYIDLTRGTGGGQIQTGGDIPLDHTLPITEIDKVLAVFDPATVQRVQLLINTLGQGTTNNGGAMNSSAGSLNDLVSALNVPATTLSVRRQQVNDIVLELQKFYTVLAAQREQVRQEFGTWTQVMQQLANQEQAIGGTVRQADLLLQNLDVLFAGNGNNLHQALLELPGTLTQLNAFFDQSNTVLKSVVQYRNSIHDTFPNLGSSFFDTDPKNGQHYWSVFSVDCNGGGCPKPASQTTPSSTAPNAFWAAAMGG
jgi:virulence factor Mce-like protein